jgi:hypothetical protein
MQVYVWLLKGFHECQLEGRIFQPQGKYKNVFTKFWPTLKYQRQDYLRILVMISYIN